VGRHPRPFIGGEGWRGRTSSPTLAFAYAFSPMLANPRDFVGDNGRPSGMASAVMPFLMPYRTRRQSVVTVAVAPGSAAVEGGNGCHAYAHPLSRSLITTLQRLRVIPSATPSSVARAC